MVIYCYFIDILLFRPFIIENTEEVIRAELEKKYGQHAELVGTLQEKQTALAEVDCQTV